LYQYTKKVSKPILILILQQKRDIAVINQLFV